MLRPIHLLSAVVLLAVVVSQRAALPSHAQTNFGVERLVWSDDGRHVALTTTFGVLIYDTTQPDALPTQIEPLGFLYPSVCFNPDNTRVALNEGVYATASGLLDYPLLADDWTYGVTACAFSPDGQWVAVGTAGNQLIIRDASNGAVIFETDDSTGDAFDETTTENGRNAVVALRFSPDSRRLYATDSYGSILLWASATWELVAANSSSQAVEINTLDLSPDGSLVLARNRNGLPYVWDAFTLENLKPVSVGNARAVGQGFLQDGRPVALYAADDGTPSLVELTSGMALGSVNFGAWYVPATEGGYQVAVNPTYSLFVVDKEAATLVYLDLNTGALAFQPYAGLAVAVRPDGAQVVYDDGAGALMLWDGVAVTSLGRYSQE